MGCGTGSVSRYIAGLPGVESVLGVDPSTYLLEVAREGGGGDTIEYREGRGDDIPAEDVRIVGDTTEDDIVDNIAE